MPPNIIIIKPSRATLRGRVEAAGHAEVLQLYWEESRTSPSARWYGDITGYEPLMLSMIKSHGTNVIMHRLRLSFPCAWQIIDRIEKSD